jgi:hypothetical protein
VVRSPNSARPRLGSVWCPRLRAGGLRCPRAAEARRAGRLAQAVILRRRRGRASDSVRHVDQSLVRQDVAGPPATRLSVPSTRLSVPLTRLSVPFTRLSVPFLLLSVPFTRLSVPFTRLSVPFTRLSVPFLLLSVPLRRPTAAMVRLRQDTAGMLGLTWRRPAQRASSSRQSPARQHAAGHAAYSQ